MKPWPTLLTFQLWNLLEVSLSQNGCSQPPVVLHAHVPEQSRKDEYRLGETIVFTCDAGFTSELPIKYVCSGEGWVTLRQVSCYSPTANCERPPAHGGLRINGLPENNSPIPPGHVLIFSCDDPEKRLNGSSVLICDRDGQWNKPVPSCEGIPCDVPQLGPGPIITRVKSGGILNLFCSSEYELDGANELKCLDSGLWSSTFPTCTRTCEMPNIPQFLRQLTHVEGTRAKKGQKLNFECRQRGKFIQGNAEIECLESGDWSDQLPKCGAVKCQSLTVNDNVQVSGDPEDGTYGNVIRFSCKYRNHILKGPIEIYCDESGEWSGDVPECREMSCDTPSIAHGRITDHPKVYKENEHLNFVCDNKYKPAGERHSRCLKVGSEAVWSPTPQCSLLQCKVNLPPIQGTTYNRYDKNMFSPGDTLTVTCEGDRWIVDMKTTRTIVTCNDDGNWDIKPECKDERVCSSPPPIEFGDIMRAKAEYREGETVEYICPNYFVMEGGPRRTCRNGQWTGHIRCIKPCTVTKEDMNKNNLEFVKDWLDKIYSAHNDHITFKCVQGKRHDGRVNMRKQCIEGVIQLPTCV